MSIFQAREWWSAEPDRDFADNGNNSEENEGGGDDDDIGDLVTWKYYHLQQIILHKKVF